MAVLLGLYYLLFEREKMHQFNRFYLLSALVFSLAIPFITISSPKEFTYDIPISANTPEIPTHQDIIPTIVNAGHESQLLENNIQLWPYLLVAAYGFIALLLTIRFALNVRCFIKKAAGNKKVRFRNANLILLQEPTVPHTFFNNIFLSKQDYLNNTIEDDLYSHELIHVNQRHTLDILFVEALKIVFWFNPLLYLYKSAIQLNHEFLADDGVLKTSDSISYQMLLLQKIASGRNLSLASQLTFKLTRKRFNMMNKKSKKHLIALKKMMLLPSITFLIILLCFESSAKIKPSIQQTSITLKDSLTDKDIKRDKYYAGVIVKIDDNIRNVKIDQPYEKLTLEQKRRYLPYVPEPKVKKPISEKEFEDYKNKSRFAIWIDDVNVDNKVLNNYKNTDIVYIIGSSVFKNARTKQHPQPFQFWLYTNAYFDKNIKDEHLKFPSNVYPITLYPEKPSTKKRKPRITEYPVEYSDVEKIYNKPIKP